MRVAATTPDTVELRLDDNARLRQRRARSMLEKCGCSYPRPPPRSLKRLAASPTTPGSCFGIPASPPPQEAPNRSAVEAGIASPFFDTSLDIGFAQDSMRRTPRSKVKGGLYGQVPRCAHVRAHF